MSQTKVLQNEYRVVGPPGTGKTTWLCKQVEKAIAAYCQRTGGLPCESRDVLVCSLTRAAANELRNRGLDIFPEQLGTLHAHAYRAVGRPPLCVDGEPLLEWNEHCDQIGKPDLKLSGKMDKEPGETRSDSASGDQILASYHRNRSQLIDRSCWTDSVAHFAENYEKWKRDCGYSDFSDVIHDAYVSTDSAPGMPSVIMVDEAQDNDRAELRLIRKWARNAEKVVIVGDPDQNLYQWRGSDPEAFDDPDLPIPPENHMVLQQSYRVPREVHAEAQRMIRRIRHRKDVVYFPRNADGAVIRDADAFTSWGQVEDSISFAKRFLDEGKRVMFLASCEYMLRPIMKELRDQGIPFWNPFARERGHFNPLTPARGISACRRLMNYLLPQESFYGQGARFWTWSELNSWVEVCRAEGLLKYGMKAEISRRAATDDEPLSFEDVAECFDQEIIDRMDADPLALFQSFVKKDRSSSLEFAARVLHRRGLAELDKTPQIVVGTVHSVKGGEADVVFVSPDLSPQGHEKYEGRGTDEVYRLFYVAMTRAKDTLVLCEPGNKGMCIDW